jgi:hypothetical protein
MRRPFSHRARTVVRRVGPGNSGPRAGAAHSPYVAACVLAGGYMTLDGG